MRPEVASLLPFTQNRQDALNCWRIPDMDLLIAATVQCYGLCLVTNDAHLALLPDTFQRENWAG